MNYAVDGNKISLGYQYRYLFLAETIFPLCGEIIDELLADSQPAISAITEIELLC